MGRYDFRPSRVHQTAQMLLSVRALRHEPPWYTAMSNYPPSETVVRTQPVKHEYTAPQGTFSMPSEAPRAPRHNNSLGARRPRKPSKMFAPKRIAYEEDQLRTDFFSDHPWELARPRQILEDDGRDYTRWDWSKAEEPGRPISGESVIQRQLHLMRARTNPKSKLAAYDTARAEHYAARHHAEVEQRIALEEARAVGAGADAVPAAAAAVGAGAAGGVGAGKGATRRKTRGRTPAPAVGFSKTANEIGMQLEKETFDRWREWAEARVVAMEQARSAAYTGDEAGGEEGQQGGGEGELGAGALGEVIDGLGLGGGAEADEGEGEGGRRRGQ